MMSTYERSTSAGSYYRPSFFGGFRFFPPVIKWLLILNVGLWLAFDFFLTPFTIGGAPVFQYVAGYLALWPIGTHFYPWQLVTYMFIHGGFWHIFLNMLSLWIFGTELEHLWGSRRFLTYYLLCGLGGAVTNLLVALLFGQGAPTVGASGAVFGVLLAFGVLFPDRPIYLWLLVPVRAKFFILGLIALELYTGIMGTMDGIAHFAHLGGAAAGAVYLAAVLKIDLLGGFRKRSEVYSGAGGRGGAGPLRSEEEIHEARFYDIRTGKPREEEPRVTQETIDAILDKIGRGGYQSLTEEEKRILQEASRNIH